MLQETSTYLRTLETTSSHVERDIVDASGNYKFYEEMDKFTFDPSLAPQRKTKEDFKIYRPDTHFVIGSAEEMTELCDYLISKTGLDTSANDRSKFRY